MKRKTCLWAAVLAVSTAMAQDRPAAPQIEPAAMRQGRDMAMPGGEGRRLGGFLGIKEDQDEAFMGRLLNHPRTREELGLTEEQVSRLQDGLAEIEKDGAALQSRLEAAAMEQVRLMMAADIDEAALMAAVENTGLVRIEIAKMRMRALLLSKRVLSPEQLEKARGLMRERAREGRPFDRNPQERPRDGWQGRPREKNEARRDPAPPNAVNQAP